MQEHRVQINICESGTYVCKQVKSSYKDERTLIKVGKTQSRMSEVQGLKPEIRGLKLQSRYVIKFLRLSDLLPPASDFTSQKSV